LSRDLGYINAEEYAALDSRIQGLKKMLASFMQRTTRAPLRTASYGLRPTAYGEGDSP
jgi:hypothetical protein